MISRKIKSAILAVSMVMTATYVGAETITMTNGEWAPYMSQKLKHDGFVSDLVVQAFKKEGVDVKWVFLPWKRAFEEAKSGKYAGSAIWGKTDERAKDFLFTKGVVTLKNVFFIKKGSNFSWNTIDDLKNKKLGGIIGYAYGGGIDKAEKAGIIKINRIGNNAGNYKKLVAGRLDAVLDAVQVGYTTARQAGVGDQVEPYKKPFESREYSVIISKKTPNAAKLVETFNKGLDALKASGEYDAILKAAQQGKYN
jgi:polar amino acid transport system substrate-binding protein